MKAKRHKSQANGKVEFCKNSRMGYSNEATNQNLHNDICDYAPSFKLLKLESSSMYRHSPIA